MIQERPLILLSTNVAVSILATYVLLTPPRATAGEPHLGTIIFDRGRASIVATVATIASEQLPKINHCTSVSDVNVLYFMRRYLTGMVVYVTVRMYHVRNFGQINLLFFFPNI